MSNIRVNITELKQILEATPADQNILLIGNHGIGKSEILTDYYSAQGMPVVALFLGQMSDPGDLIGIPHKNLETGKTDFMPPYWFPTDGKPIVLLLDEMNRARPEILQTIMDLALNRKLAGRSLPEGSRIISAVNEGDQYQLTDLDPALVSRFNAYTFSPTAQEWLLWARKSGVDSRVISFIEENPQWLDKDPDAKSGAATGLDKTPDRRAWKRVSDIVKNHSNIPAAYSKLISGLVGPRATSAFLGSVSAHRILSGRDILYNFSKHIETLAGYEIHEISTINDGVFRHLEIEKIPEKDKAAVAKNLEDYFDWMTKNRKEGAGYFANLYVSGTYPNAVAFMARDCRMLTMCLVTYVKSIRV